MEGQVADATGFNLSTVVGMASIADVGEQLDELAFEVGAPATMRWQVVHAWLAARPQLNSLAVLVRNRGRLVAAALLVRERRAGFWDFRKVGTAGEPFVLLADGEQARQELAAGIGRELDDVSGGWRLQLSDLPADDPATAVLSQALPATRRHRRADTPQLVFDEAAGLNRYLSRNVRSAVAKARNRIAADSLTLTMDWLSTPAELAERTAEVVAIRRDRNQQLRRSLPENQQEVATFTASIAAHAEAGSARLLELRIGDEMAAYAVCFLTDGELWVYSNSVSPAYTHYSAGTIANAEVVRYAHADPAVRVLNWGAGIQRYKLSGPVQLVETETLVAWSSSATRRALAIAQKGKQLLRAGG